MKKSKTIFFIVAIIILFLLNLFWEVSHSLLYDWNAIPLENNIYFYIPKILLASFGDVMYISITFLVISIFKKNFSWIFQPKNSDYTILVILGLILAIFIEIKAKLFGLWHYNMYMPKIFGVGLTPLIQLAITSSLTLFVINKFWRLK